MHYSLQLHLLWPPTIPNQWTYWCGCSVKRMTSRWAKCGAGAERWRPLQAADRRYRTDPDGWSIRRLQQRRRQRQQGGPGVDPALRRAARQEPRRPSGRTSVRAFRSFRCTTRRWTTQIRCSAGLRFLCPNWTDTTWFLSSLFFTVFFTNTHRSLSLKTVKTNVLSFTEQFLPIDSVGTSRTFFLA